MEAKDTAIHQENCELSHIKINFGKCTCGAEHQAEISFKAGIREANRESSDIDDFDRKALECAKRVGIREVVKDIEAKYMVKNSANPDFLRNGIIIASPEQWQAFKEEKGINE